MTNTSCELVRAIHIHQELMAYRDELYLTTIQRMQEQASAILKNDMGTKFVTNCVRDLAGEVVRTFFNTSDYHITVDQMFFRIKNFSYENEYDPLHNNTEVQKNVYNYNDMSQSQKNATLNEINKHLGTNLSVPEGVFDEIVADIDNSQQKLFELERSKDYSDTKARKEYRNSRADENGDLYDDITGAKGQKTTVIKNGKEESRSDLHADHIQSREAATFNTKYLKEQGVQELRDFINSADNMQLMHATANTSKSDIRVCEVNGKIVAKKTNEADYDPSTDITHKATPEQLAEATCQQWEKDTELQKVNKLKELGYLNEDGKVPDSVRKKLESNIRHSQNAESKIILKNTNYGQVAKDSATNLFTKQTTDANGNTSRKLSMNSPIGKMIAGQVMYYALPPLIYEVRVILSKGKIALNNALEEISASGKRLIEYIHSKLKDIFTNVATSSLKMFIKTFMDILINLVKSTIKKMLKIIKSVVLSVVDSVKIIVTPGTSPAQKADAVFKLMGVTITNILLETLFEIIEKGGHIPEFLLSPLQILTSVLCTNLVMLVLEEADLFNVNFGFKIEQLEEMFENERANFIQQVEETEKASKEEIDKILEHTKRQCEEIHKQLKSFNPYEDSVRETLQSISDIFNMNINFEDEWQKFVSGNA